MDEKITQYPELKYYRIKVAKCSMNVLVKRIDMDLYSYLQCENGVREFTLKEAEQIALALDIPLGKLFPKIFNLIVD